MLLRKPNRIPEWDYRSMGAYFITICSHRKEHIFSNITRVDPQSKNQYPYHRQTAYENELHQLRLSLIGQVIEKAIAGIEERYQGITVDHYVIMPNHVHLLLQIHELEKCSGTLRFHPCRMHQPPPFCLTGTLICYNSFGTT